MRLFYNPQFNPASPSLAEEELKHAVRVLRLTVGDIIHIVDGKGNRYITQIIDVTKKSCELKLIRTEEIPPSFPYKLHIAIAPTKQIDRIEWFLEKATEIGISEITPIWCEHSERKQVKTDRLEKIIVSAMKQSLQATIPKLNNPKPFKDFVNEVEATEKYIAHCEPETKQHLKHIYKGGNVVILIGPEGDFSSTEIDLALAHHYTPISLGENRLRTETAALTANQIIHLHHA